MFKEGKNSITTAKKHKKGFPCDRAEKSVISSEKKIVVVVEIDVKTT